METTSLELFSKAYQISQDPFFLEESSETVAWIKIEMLQEGRWFSTPPKMQISEGWKGNFTRGPMPSLLKYFQTTCLVSKTLYLKPMENWEDSGPISYSKTKVLSAIATEFGMSESEFIAKS